MPPPLAPSTGSPLPGGGGALLVFPVEVPDGVDADGYVVGQTNAQFLDQREELDQVVGVEAQVLVEPGVSHHLVRFQIQRVAHAPCELVERKRCRVQSCSNCDAS